jgi:hypothetical protein
MAHFSVDALVWAHYFEKPNKKLDQDKLAAWDDSLRTSFGTAIEDACTSAGIPANKANRSHILALSIIARGSGLKERVSSATRFYKGVVDNGLLP